jgi:flagellin-like hook-associated protein FlgL
MYVASNPIALSAQYGLTRNMGGLSDVLTRLSTGLKINSGKDDPAGLIASELLKAQITGTSKAITNTQRANSLVAVADSALGSISNLLNDIKGLVVEAANSGTMTSEQVKANQLQVDAALDSIDRIARSTNYTGKKLLDGSLDFRTAGVSSSLSNVQVNSANFGSAGAIGVNVNVQQAADYARLISNGTGVSVDTTFDVIGSRGSSTVKLGGGSSNADIAAAINRYTDSTGVLAYVEGQAERGSIVLSSAGKNNDILVTALETGLDAGNYEFRITQGTTNDARVVLDAKDGKPGIIEISLVAAQEAQYKNFAGMFDVSIDTSARGANAATSMSISQGTANKVIYSDQNSEAATNSVSGISMTASVDMGGGVMSNSALNGWSVVVNNTEVSAAGEEFVDLGSKTVYVNAASGASDIKNVLEIALAKTTAGGAATAPTVTVTTNGLVPGTGFSNGDRYTFGGGASKGEVLITYKEGATAGDILSLLNSAPNVQASLSSGVSADTLVPNVFTGRTNMSSTSTTQSQYTSAATSQQVIDLINSKLGDKFMATSLGSDGTGGRVSFMDAAVDYGDVNMGNAIRFSGMDNGPIVRLTNLGSNGQKVANQKLSVSVIHPSESDIKAGIHTPVLEIKLATDAQGNSITTAKDIVDLFNTLTPEKTMGVSASQLYPPGVDPNGRIFTVDATGKLCIDETCPTPINGIVQPTGTPGFCGPDQGDLVLLGGNQKMVDDNAIARISGNNRPVAATGPVTTKGTNPAATTTAIFDTAAGGSGASLTFSNALIDALKGLKIEIADGGATPPHVTFDGAGTLTVSLATADLAAASAPGAIAGVLGDLFDGHQSEPTADYHGIFLALNEWRTDNGLAAIADNFSVTTADVTAVSGTGLTAGDTFIIAPNAAPPAPTLTFSAEDAKALSGVTFTFTNDATGWVGSTKTLNISTNTAYANDGDLLLAVNGALTTHWSSIATTLGLDGTPGSEIQAQVASNFDSVVFGTTAAESSSTRVPVSVDTSKAITDAMPGAGIGKDGSAILTFDSTSALNGITFSFTRDEKKEGFDYGSGTLLIFLGSEFDALADKTSANAAANNMLRTAVDSAIAANWESIRSYTQSGGDAVKLSKDQMITASGQPGFSVENALEDATNADNPLAYAGDGKTMISSSSMEGTAIGTRGVGPADSVLNIVALGKGMNMAGIGIHFVNDPNSGLAQWNNAYDPEYANDAALPVIDVKFMEKEDGSKELIITANLGPDASSELNAGLLARALNANSVFNGFFKAEATQFGSTGSLGDGVSGSVLFNNDPTKLSGQTVGGYRIESSPIGTNKTGTSSGVGMTGQSDSNERLIIESEDLGSGQSVNINVISGAFSTVDESGYSSNFATGKDMVATINGLRAIANGNNIAIDTPDLSVSMNALNAVGSAGFSITGGGALFQLGSEVTSQQQIRVGIASMLTSKLGGASGQLFMLKKGNVASLESSDNGRRLADRIVTEAIENVASLRGRLGAIQRGTLEPTVSALQDSMIALTESNAMITNADFAVESSNLTRLQLLIQAGAQTLGIANQLPQYAAMLVR